MFFYSLPILFNELDLITPSESLLISTAIFAMLYLAAPVPSLGQTMPNTENYLLMAWLGEVKLNLVFWPFFLLFNTIIIGTDWLVSASKITVSSWDDIHFVMLFPVIWWITSVWRCSIHTGKMLWAALARLATLAVVAEYALKLLIRIDYPRLFFKCEALLTNYTSCF